MIVLDFETNSKNSKDVLEVGALKLEKQGNIYVVVDTFHRYYHSKYDIDPWALKVHNLSPERISKLREGATYAKHFEDDYDFKTFCDGCTTLIAHNISFELRYLDGMVSFDNHFCTMKTNTDNVGALKINGHRKPPSLLEACNHYQIDFNENQYHSALYDAQKAFEIFNKMNSSDILSAIIMDNRTIDVAKKTYKLNRVEETIINLEPNKSKRTTEKAQWSGLICPQFSSGFFTLKGKRQHKHYEVQRFQCNECLRIFTQKISEDGSPVDFVSKNTKDTTSNQSACNEIIELTATPQKSQTPKVQPEVTKKQFEYIILETPKDSQLIERIKSIPGRRWETNTMSWEIPFCENYQEFLESKFGDIADVSCRNGRDICYSKIIRAKISLYRTASYDTGGNSSSEGCYIATAVYGSYEAPEVLILRKFRDTVLKRYLLGEVLISFYYFVSPSIAQMLKGKKRINYMIKMILDEFVRVLK